MELQEFITDALTQIHRGVAAASAATQGHVSPHPDSRVAVFGSSDAVGVRMSPAGPVSIVKFDVAVTAKETSASGGGGSVQVAGLFSAGGEKSTGTEASRVSRIQFDVLVVLPHAAKPLPIGDDEPADDKHGSLDPYSTG